MSRAKELVPMVKTAEIAEGFKIVDINGSLVISRGEFDVIFSGMVFEPWNPAKTEERRALARIAMLAPAEAKPGVIGDLVQQHSRKHRVKMAVRRVEHLWVKRATNRKQGEIASALEIPEHNPLMDTNPSMSACEPGQ